MVDTAGNLQSNKWELNHFLAQKFGSEAERQSLLPEGRTLGIRDSYECGFLSTFGRAGSEMSGVQGDFIRFIGAVLPLVTLLSHGGKDWGQKKQGQGQNQQQHQGQQQNLRATTKSRETARTTAAGGAPAPHGQGWLG